MVALPPRAMAWLDEGLAAPSMHVPPALGLQQPYVCTGLNVLMRLPHGDAIELWTSIYLTYPILRRGLAVLAGRKLSVPDEACFLLKELGNLSGHKQLKEQGGSCQRLSVWAAS